MNRNPDDSSDDYKVILKDYGYTSLEPDRDDPLRSQLLIEKLLEQKNTCPVQPHKYIAFEGTWRSDVFLESLKKAFSYVTFFDEPVSFSNSNTNTLEGKAFFDVFALNPRKLGFMNQAELLFGYRKLPRKAIVVSIGSGETLVDVSSKKLLQNGYLTVKEFETLVWYERNCIPQPDVIVHVQGPEDSLQTGDAFYDEFFEDGSLLNSSSDFMQELEIEYEHFFEKNRERVVPFKYPSNPHEAVDSLREILRKHC